MNKSFIVDKNKTVSFNEIFRQVPASIYASEVHDDVCYFIAKSVMQGKDEEFVKLYTNILLLKSKKTRVLSALIYLIDHDALYPDEIHCMYVDSEFFSHFLGKRSDTIKIFGGKKYTDLLDTKYRYVVFPAKAMIHNLYRLLQRKVSYKPQCIKTYVEDTIRFYPDEIKESTIMIYPFNLNFNRQRGFINYCKKNHPEDYTLMGINYSLFRLLFFFFRYRMGDEAIVRLEYDGYKRHAKELLSKGLRKLYTLDEYEAASFVMHGYLMKNGVYVVNKTHGVGGYCLFLNYSKLYVYTSKQYKRYKKWNPDLQIVYNDLKIEDAKKETRSDAIEVVIMNGNMQAYGLYYEEDLERKIIEKLKESCDELGLRFSIKFHPNTFEKDKEIYKKMGISIVESVDSIENPLFVTIFSTSFYDFLKYGPFVFLSDDLLNPKDVFGDDIEYTNYEDAKETLLSLTDMQNYKKLHAMQIRRLRDR